MEFRLLGPVEARAGGRSIDLGSRKQRFVLAVLALEVNRLVPVSRLVDLTWGGAPPATARTVIHTHIYRLRTALAKTDTRDAVRLATAGTGYTLHADPMTVDVHRFRALVEQGRLAGDDEQRVAYLAEALKLWRGPALEGAAPADTRHRLCAGLDEARLAAVEDRIDAELRLGRHRDVLDELIQLAQLHPSRERLVGQLMLAFYRGGRAADALRVSRESRRRLADEHGLDPGTELQELERAILRNDPGLGSPPSATNPEPIAPVPAQLPTDVVPFTGRDSELDGLDKLTEASAVVVIAGTAGVGKTALGVHWGHRVRDRFPDGQLYADLRGYAAGTPLRPVQVLGAFLHALEVPADRIPVDEDTAVGLYRSLLADKRVLVVLDNARDAAQVRPLLPGGSGCLALVTSRERLTALLVQDGALRITLDALTPEAARALLTRLLGTGRVGFDGDAIAELARACGYLPLAIRIAAAHLVDHPAHSVARYLKELNDGSRLAALEVGAGEPVGVRAAFDVSYAGLSAPARRLFRLLGLVPGADFSVAAAAALGQTTPARALRLLDRLASAHLIVEPAAGRYAFHDLLRVYAAERADTDDSEADRAAALRRLLDWYGYRVDSAARLLYPNVLRLPLPAAAPDPDGFPDTAHALVWLDTERPNLVAAVRHAARYGPHRSAWLLADALRHYFVQRLYTVDWLTVAQAGLAAAEAEDDLQAQAAARLSLADSHLLRGLHRPAAVHYAQAVALARRSGWPACQAAALGNLGSACRFAGRLRAAIRYYTQALTLDRQNGLLAGQANHLSNLGVSYRLLGRLARAAEYYAEALEIHRRIAADARRSTTLSNLADVRHLLGDPGAARRLLTDALGIQRDIGYRVGEAEALRTLASVYRDGGRYDEALEYADRALALEIEIRDPRGECDALNVLGSICHAIRRSQQALGHHGRALRLARDTGDRHLETEALLGLAAAYQQLSELDRARTNANDAHTIARRGGYRLLEGEALARLAAVHLTAGEPEQAVGYGERALAIQRDTGYRLGEARALQVLAEALNRLGQPF